MALSHPKQCGSEVLIFFFSPESQKNNEKTLKNTFAHESDCKKKSTYPKRTQVFPEKMLSREKIEPEVGSSNTLVKKLVSSVLTPPVSKNFCSHPKQCGSKDLIVFFSSPDCLKNDMRRKFKQVSPKSDCEKFHVF